MIWPRWASAISKFEIEVKTCRCGGNEWTGSRRLGANRTVSELGHPDRAAYIFLITTQLAALKARLAEPLYEALRQSRLS